MQPGWGSGVFWPTPFTRHSSVYPGGFPPYLLVRHSKLSRTIDGDRSLAGFATFLSTWRVHGREHPSGIGIAVPHYRRER